MLLRLTVLVLLQVLHIHAFRLTKLVAKAASIALLSSSILPLPALADSTSSSTLSGIVSLAPETKAPNSDKAALYITVKQDPGLWVSAVRNIKDPPVLTKRISPVSSFPIDFTLTKDDSTPEGLAVFKDWTSGRLPLAVRNI